MVIIAQHLKCDMNNRCSSCSKYLVSPKYERRYFYCADCKSDILCDRGLIQNFSTETSFIIKKLNLCMRCNGEVVERMWPDDIEILK